MTKTPKANDASVAPPIRVLVVDDHPVARAGLIAILHRRKALRVVGEAATSSAAIATYDQLRPDVVVMDLRLPDRDGIATTAILVTRAPPAKVLMLTTFDGEDDVRRAFAAGAMGYLRKDVETADLWAAVEQVAAGQRALGPAIAAKMAEALALPGLSERELAVLQHLANGLANKAIGQQLHIAEATVKAHVHALMQKLGAGNRTECILIAQRRGLIRQP
jgi:two-component system, NarL family, response regulator